MRAHADAAPEPHQEGEPDLGARVPRDLQDDRHGRGARGRAPFAQGLLGRPRPVRDVADARDVHRGPAGHQVPAGLPQGREGLAGHHDALRQLGRRQDLFPGGDDRALPQVRQHGLEHPAHHLAQPGGEDRQDARAAEEAALEQLLPRHRYLREGRQGVQGGRRGVLQEARAVRHREARRERADRL